jgi:hypothetical protein
MMVPALFGNNQTITDDSGHNDNNNLDDGALKFLSDHYGKAVR